MEKHSMTKGTIAFCGCSSTSGFGLDPDDVFNDAYTHPTLWVNLAHQNIEKIQGTALTNRANRARSNTDIFEQATRALTEDNDLQFLICGWTSMPRYVSEVGFELYDTVDNVERCPKDQQLNDVHYSDSYLQKTIDRFRALHHVQYEIVKLVRYINILKKFCDQRNITLINVNVMCPWDQDFFLKLKEPFLPDELTPYTKEIILNVDNRDDQEIFDLYKKQHDQYDEQGGIHPDTWVDLYHNFQLLGVDLAYDNDHPGVESNKLYFNQLKTYVDNL